MKPLLLSNEFPPHIYGGAGIHVHYLSRELSKLCDVEVRCFGSQNSPDTNPAAFGFEADTSGYTAPKNLHGLFGTLQRCLDFNTREIDADIVHLHTWYSHFGGILAKLNYGLPLVLTVHSLEPLRPWKREQLGGGYDFTCWLEKTAIEMADAVIAVSTETKEDILRLFDVPEERVPVIYNGIDPEEYQIREDPELLQRLEIDPEQPFVLFVGRITRQKGIIHLVNAIQHMTPGTQVVLCAGAPDTPEIAAEMKLAVEEARNLSSGNIVWVEEMLPEPEKIALYSHASVFVCPSIYEPFGIINLEAMACETPVVASRVGGMKEVIVDGETGLLVSLEQQTESPFEPVDPEAFARDLAEGVNELMSNDSRREAMAKAGRERVLEQFSWTSIAKQTLDLYENLVQA
ncbi:MAG: glycogen synthase [Verrucomicrobiales bacterium]|nr:glycogen synthase [Verrucomicrobiales bacterium]